MFRLSLRHAPAETRGPDHWRPELVRLQDGKGIEVINLGLGVNPKGQRRRDAHPVRRLEFHGTPPPRFIEKIRETAHLP